jgi:parallel beta-helix repeat protein
VLKATAGRPAAAPAPIEAGRLQLSVCQDSVVTLIADADAWVSENVPNANFAADGILFVNAGSPTVAGGPPGGRTRALVRFALPPAIPAGCIVESARLRLYTPGDSAGARVEAVRAAAPWSEGVVTWDDQPLGTGEPARAWSREGYMQWNVTAQVAAMFAGDNHGLLLRDAAEQDDAGGDHGYHSREKGDDPPQLVIHFAAPPSGEPGPPAPPEPAVVSCGEVLGRSTLVMNDLSNCPADGLIIGSSRIIVDLDGHTIDGVGLGTGIRNDGHTLVAIRNGTVRDFDYGVELLSETSFNLVENLTFELNQLGAIELFDAWEGNSIRNNTLHENGEGVALVSGTRWARVEGNTITRPFGAGILLRDATAIYVARNTIMDGSDLGIQLERASGNELVDNVLSRTSDGGFEIRDHSHHNLVARNSITQAGDMGIIVADSDGNQLIANRARGMSDSGITLDNANDGVVRGNDVRGNPGGIEAGDSSRNLIEGNDVSEGTGIGIELGGGSFNNVIAYNKATGNAAKGIYISGGALPEEGNLLKGNVAIGNGDGIFLAMGGHTLSDNLARDNRGWGIYAAPDVSDGGGNVAYNNGERSQCYAIMCGGAPPDTNAPETTIASGPAATTTSTSASFSFSSSEGSSTFECALDGAAFVACVSPSSYAALSLGAHSFAVRARDNAGNIDLTPAVHTWTIVAPPDTTAPDTFIVSRPAASSTETSASFAFSASEAGSTFQCSLDGAAFATCTSPRAYSNLSIGSHSFAVRARDAAGNVDATPASYAWVIEAPPPPPVVGGECGSPIALVASADAWIDQNSSSNFGRDSILKVQAKDSTNNMRALVRFSLPARPQGCVVHSATLRVHAVSGAPNRTLHALRVAAPWGENTVRWGTQPRTSGVAAVAASGTGWREWNVAAHVQAMYDLSTAYGFLIRDAVEGVGSYEQQFHSREKAERRPELIILFGKPQ